MNEHAAAMNKVLVEDEENDPHWILCPVSGRMVSYSKPWENTYVIEEAALLLANVNRFTGQVKVSVARHSINVSRAVEFRVRPFLSQLRWKAHVAMAGLLHDVEEAWIGDMSTPLKRLCPDFCLISDELKRAALTSLWPTEQSTYDQYDWDVLHDVDREMCQLERDVHIIDSEYWPISGNPIPEPLTEADLHEGAEPFMVASEFISRYHALAAEMRQEQYWWDCL